MRPTVNEELLMFKPLIAALCGLVLHVTATAAQTYPSKPITLLVPFAAGGPADTLARMLGERMRTTLGQNIIVENAAGAAGSLGVGRLVRAAPDGYTFGIGHLGTHVFNGALYKLPYDLINDLEPISLLPSNSYVIVTRPGVPAKDMTELVAWLQANPDKATVATAGLGSIAHLAAMYFQDMTGVPLRVVPYRGGGAAMTDVMGGQITLYFDQMSGASLSMYSGKKLEPFAVMAPRRLSLAPDIPTVDEVGLPGLYASAWYGFWAPKGTPGDIITKLQDATVAALADPELRRRLEEQGAQIPPPEQQTPAALARFQKSEIEKWWPIIKAANVKPE
jgi:tripartite-type tricarboxylate transporter receptor subunit TctC